MSIGFALVSAVLIGGPSTGGAVNPVLALGPEPVSGTFTSFWVYLLAPTVGGIAAAVVYDRVTARRRTPTPGTARCAAAGRPAVSMRPWAENLPLLAVVVPDTTRTDMRLVGELDMATVRS